MRIDNYLYENNKFSSRTKAKEAVERGEVLVNGRAVKPSFDVSDSDTITFAEDAGIYVSNGAFKLEKALNDFDFNVLEKTVADVGASTGGFTQCLLLSGAKRVFALDVGESLLHPSLAQDERVVVLDNVNARFMTEQTFGCLLDAVVTDVSFISLTYILAPIYSVLKSDGEAVVLIKPQFECGQKNLTKNGIVKDKSVRYDVCKKILAYSESVGFGVVGLSVAPIRQGKNVEYLLHLAKGRDSTVNEGVVRDVCLK